MKRISNTSQFESPIKNDSKALDIQNFIQMRSKMNNSEIKGRKSSQSVVMFNNNVAINNFKKSIPELKIFRRDQIVTPEQQELLNQNSNDSNDDDVMIEQELRLSGSPSKESSPVISPQTSEPRIRESNIKEQSYAPSMTQSRTSIHEEPLMGESESAMDRQILSLSSLNMKSTSANNQSRQISSQLSKNQIRNQMGCSQQVLEEKAEHDEESPKDDQREVPAGRSSAMESKSATLRLDKLIQKTETIKNDQVDMKSAMVPPAEDIYRPKLTVKHDSVNFGLNMYFKKYHEFSTDPDQAGGDLAPNQQFLSQPWGYTGCPPARQVCLTDYVLQNLKDVVYSRYGMEYLRSFPRVDDLCIGSYRINLDYLIFQKQRHLDTDNNASLVGMSFLKTKGQVAMNRQANSPDRKSSGGQLGASSSMIIPFYKSVDQSEESLQFDSVFESGNLAIAIKVSEIEYNLLLQNDINTNGHTQWFYFKVKSNFTQDTVVDINLINLYKAKSLYQMGLRVCYLDVTTDKVEGDLNKKKEKPELPKWKRSEHSVSYIQNKFTNEQCPNGLFSVKFQFEFKAGEREIYFAHSMPYTYSMLTTYLNKNVTKEKAKRQVLCHSLAGNKVEYLYITGKNKRVDAPPQQVAKDDFDEGHNSMRKNNLREEMSGANKTSQAFKRQKSLTKKDKKKIIEPQQPKQIEKQVLILTSRVHPGETNASWMIQGLMDLLLNPSTPEEVELVKNLRDHFEIYIIPMLNTDGVINGNYRCSLAACDLNRKYLKPSKVLHPAVYYTKKLCQTLQEQDKKQFFLYLDFHGHSAKKNIFQYGNRTDAWGPSRQKQYQMHHPSLFPLMLSKQFDYFNFNDCTFKMDKSKEGTGRIALFHKLRIPFVFTLEASFAGASKGSMAGKHFSQGDLMNVGKYVLKAIWEIKKLELNKTLLKQINDEASKHAKINQADDTGDSDGCSSSEEDAEIPTNSKKAIQIIKEEIDSPEIKKRELKGEQRVPPKTGVAGSRQAHNPNNRSIINLKTIVVDNRNCANQNNSPRKMEHQMNKNQSDKTHVRRSIRQQNQQSQQMQIQEPPLGMNSQESNYPHSQGGHYGEYTTRQMRNQQPQQYKSEDSGPNMHDINSEINYQQQVLFEQFNAEIEKSFSEQQNHLDEIFKHTAKQFLDQNHQKRNSRSQYKYQPSEIPSGGKNNNFFLEQFLVQHRQKNQVAVDQPQQQVQTLIQLQKLHQMQKLNQMAQMQFFRQQADLLLSQNLSAQQQLELFQQFSYYQAQIQMQNQQYQMMLSNSIHGSNMNHLQNQRRATHQRFASQHANIPSYQRPQQRGSTVHPHILQEPATVISSGVINPHVTSPTPPMFHDHFADDYYNNLNQVVQQQSSTGTRFLGGRGSAVNKGSVQMEIQQQDYQANNPQMLQPNHQQQVVFGAQTPNAPNQERQHQTMIKLKKGLIPPDVHHNQNFSQILNNHIVDQNTNEFRGANGQQSLIYHNRFFQTRQPNLHNNIASGRFKNMKDFHQTQQSHNAVYGGLGKPSSQHFSRQDQKEANHLRNNTQNCINVSQQNTQHVESLDQVQNEARLLHQHYRTQNYNKKKEVRVGNFDHADVISETQLKKEKYDQPLILDMRTHKDQPIQVNQQIFNIQLHPNQRFKMPLTDVNPGSLQSPQNNRSHGASQSHQSSQKFEVTIGKNKLNPVLQQNTLRTGNLNAYNEITMRGEKVRNNQQLPPRTQESQDDMIKKGGYPINMGILATCYPDLKDKTLGINKSQDENIMKKHQFNMEQQIQQIDNHPPMVLQTAPIAQGTRKTPSSFQNYPPERQQQGKTTNHQLFIKTQREIMQGRRESATDESNLPIIQINQLQSQQNPSRYGQNIKLNNNQQQQ